MTPEHLAQVHRLIPEGTARNIAVIAPSRLDSESGAATPIDQIRAAGKAIPFFGLLLNLASAGNPVCIFDGNEEAVPYGCRDADLLFIDSILADKLTARMIEAAANVMRSANIAVYDRASRKIALIRHVGPSQEKLVFRD